MLADIDEHPFRGTLRVKLTVRLRIYQNLHGAYEITDHVLGIELARGTMALVLVIILAIGNTPPALDMSA